MEQDKKSNNDATDAADNQLRPDDDSCLDKNLGQNVSNQLLFEVDHVKMQNLHMANAHSQLDDFSIYMANLLNERISSIGMPIGDKITAQTVFDFHIRLLTKYKPS